MERQQAKKLIAPAIAAHPGVWADLGAGSGIFTLALADLLPGGVVYALDKSPHLLWRLNSAGPTRISPIEGDFTQAMDLPQLDGILMANALHYAIHPAEVWRGILRYLKPGGRFILIEYDTAQPRPPWNPYPLPAEKVAALAAELGLSPGWEAGRLPSAYGHAALYCMVFDKPEGLIGELAA